MVSIYSCKLYRASTRKKEIRAAINDPINVELVKQLRSYLDEEYQSPDYVDTGNPDTPDDDTEEKIRPSESSGGGGGGYSGGLDTDMSDMLSEESGGDDFAPEGGSETDESDTDQEDSEPVGESVKIQSSTDIVDSIASQLDSIKGILNSRQETTGVSRIQIKSNDCDKELWIYYNDSINLNNVMEPAISLLNASNYAYLDFNRLARTDNAIVFIITDSPKQVTSEVDPVE